MIQRIVPPKFIEWLESCVSTNSPTTMDFVNYIGMNIHPDDMLILGRLLFPSIIEVEDCVFLDVFVPDNMQEIAHNLIHKEKRDRRYIEDNYNIFHIYDIFYSIGDGSKDEIFEEIGRLLQYSWNLHFKYALPHRNITVDLIISDQEYGPLIQFYQID